MPHEEVPEALAYHLSHLDLFQNTRRNNDVLVKRDEFFKYAVFR